MSVYRKKLNPIYFKLLGIILITISFYSIFPSFVYSVDMSLKSHVRSQALQYKNKSLISNKRSSFKYNRYLLSKSISTPYKDLEIILPDISDEEINFYPEISYNLNSKKNNRSIKRTVLSYVIFSSCVVAILIIISYNIKIPPSFSLHCSIKYKLKNKIKY